MSSSGGSIKNTVTPAKKGLFFWSDFGLHRNFCTDKKTWKNGSNGKTQTSRNHQFVGYMSAFGRCRWTGWVVFSQLCRLKVHRLCRFSIRNQFFFQEYPFETRSIPVLLTHVSGRCSTVPAPGLPSNTKQRFWRHRVEQHIQLPRNAEALDTNRNLRLKKKCLLKTTLLVAKL